MPEHTVAPETSVECEVTEVAWQSIFLSFLITIDQDSHLTGDPESPRRDLSASRHASPELNVDGIRHDTALIPSLLADVAHDEFAFLLVDEDRVLRLPVEHVSDDSYRATINVTNFQDRSQVPNGTWRIVPVRNGIFYRAARFNLAQLPKLEEWSRTFIYNNNRSSYSFTFDISEHDTRPEFLLRSYQFGRSGTKKSDRTANPLARVIRYPLKKIYNKKNAVRFLNQYYQFWRRRAPHRGDHIVFTSEARDGLGGNLLAIRDRMIERGLDKKFTLSYLFLLPSTLNKRVRLKQIRLLASADFILVDDYFPLLDKISFDPKTVIIQAWHAGSGFKAIGYSRFGKYGSPMLSNAHRHYTYAITGSQHLIPVYAEAFGIEESAIIPTGLPRIDKFLDPETTEATKVEFAQRYPHLVGKRIILFAPTFRGRGMTTAYYDYSQIDFDALYEMCGEDTVVLFRMHHFVTQPVPIRAEHADRFFDFSHYKDGLGLLHVTDVLITDYSSIIYEYALLNRPMVFFAYDKDVYSATRGFHRDFDSTAPGTVCTTFECLVETLSTENYDLERIARFREENFDRIDTHSSDRFIDWLILGERPEAIA